MARIILLDEQTINRIAAGEVVERPASVVKELVENSLDAGAKRIEVEVEMGGRRLIRVRDDGCGMSQEEAPLALQRHATSKIRRVEDLSFIRSLGFRGEALPSIAAVSRLELVSHTAEEESGVQIRVQGGQVLEVTPIGAPVGTTVTVRDLFFNTPARLKFLKTVPTELGHILETMVRYAFAYPEISFRLTHEKQELLFTPGNSDLLSVLASVWGREIARAMVQVEREHKGVRVHGLVSPPHASRPTRQHQLFYVNRRPVRNRLLSAALDEAYRALTPEKRHPVAVLLIEVDSRLVDVNVHPTKSEVKFAREHDVYEAVYQGVRQALIEHGMIPSAIGAAPVPTAPAAAPPGSKIAAASQAPLPSLPEGGERDASVRPAQPEPFERPRGPYVPEADILHQILVQRAGIETPGPAATIETPGVQPGVSAEEAFTVPPEAAPLAPSHLPFADLLDELQILGQVRNTFIVASTRKGLVILDQHVAHERVLYEQFCRLKGGTPLPRQYLLTPQTLSLERRSALFLTEKLEELAQLGFELEPFGTDTFLLRAVPATLANKDYLGVLRDLVEELVEISIARRLPVAREQIWITTACKMAVKAGDALNLPEMQKLIEELARTENPYLCPHGRPITLTLTWEELEKRFKRT